MISKRPRPALSVDDATRAALRDPRFATERRTIHDRDTLVWASGPQHLADIFALSQARPEAEYLVMGDIRLSYGTFGKAARHLAAALVTAGVDAGDRVALLMRNRLEWPVAFFAIALAGGVAVPLNGWADDAQLQAAIDDAEPYILVHDLGDRAPCFSGVAHIWTMADLPLPAPSAWHDLTPSDLPDMLRNPDDLAAIFYTSGTTGRPKGAMLTHRAISASVRNAEFQKARLLLRYPPAEEVAAAEQQVCLYPVPFFHVTGAIAGVVAYTGLGDRLVLMHKWDAGAALDLIERERVTILGGVPTMPLQLLQHPSLPHRDLSSLQGVLYGGACPPTHLPAAIETRLSALPANGWGMTETAAAFLFNAGSDYLARPESCGLPVPVNRARIVGTDGEPLPNDAIGELQVAGVNITPGYWRNPNATSDAFDGAWFRTGDLARIDAEGFVTIVDRLKDIIIRGGENIASVEIEDALMAHPAVIDCAVVSRAHSLLGEEPVAFVLLAPGTSGTDDLAAAMLAKLGRQKAPAAYHITDAPLPRNAAGKVLKQQLRLPTG